MQLIFVPAIVAIYAGAIVSLLVFPLNEQTHRRNLATLGARRRERSEHLTDEEAA